MAMRDSSVFEKDKIITAKRWVVYLNTSNRKYLTHPRRYIGRITGYKTRQEALAAAQTYIHKEVYDVDEQNLNDLYSHTDNILSRVLRMINS